MKANNKHHIYNKRRKVQNYTAQYIFFYKIVIFGREILINKEYEMDGMTQRLYYGIHSHPFYENKSFEFQHDNGISFMGSD